MIIEEFYSHEKVFLYKNIEIQIKRTRETFCYLFLMMMISFKLVKKVLFRNEII